MKRNLNLLSLLVVLALASCQKQQILEEPLQTAQAKAPSTGSENIYLTVTIHDGNMINSDGKGAYTHGQLGVEAQILSSDGNFYMNTNSNTSKAAQRWLVFQNESSYVDNYGNQVMMNKKDNYSLRTTAKMWLQKMVPGGNLS